MNSALPSPHESDVSKVVRLAAELNRLLADKIDNMDQADAAQSSSDPAPENV
jgi:hypothetical protein